MEVRIAEQYKTRQKLVGQKAGNKQKGAKNMAKLTKEDRHNLIGRICMMNTIFIKEYREELLKAKEEKKKAEEMMKEESDEIRCMVMTGDWNAKVDLDCIKTCSEIFDYLYDEENDVEPWQLIAINAMMDKCNEDNSVDYALPQAISDVLGIRFMKD